MVNSPPFQEQFHEIEQTAFFSRLLLLKQLLRVSSQFENPPPLFEARLVDRLVPFDRAQAASLFCTPGAVARLVGIEGGVVSEVINLESSGVDAPDRRPRHGQPYNELRFRAAC